MGRLAAVRVWVLVVLSGLVLVRVAEAQDAGIAGVVKDTTGAVLPGVTVTVTSPVLIEQQRTAVTDAEGRYVITQLRPGVYKVTFTLPGSARSSARASRCRPASPRTSTANCGSAGWQKR